MEWVRNWKKKVTTIVKVLSHNRAKKRGRGATQVVCSLLQQVVGAEESIIFKVVIDVCVLINAL